MERENPKVTTLQEEQVMGNRDARGREKRKPKRKEIKQMGRPPKPVHEYKPAAPAQQERANTDPAKIP